MPWQSHTGSNACSASSSGGTTTALPGALWPPPSPGRQGGWVDRAGRPPGDVTAGGGPPSLAGLV